MAFFGLTTTLSHLLLGLGERERALLSLCVLR